MREAHGFVRMKVTVDRHTASTGPEPDNHEVATILFADLHRELLGLNNRLVTAVAHTLTIKVVPRVGFDPTTLRLSSACSTK